MSSHFRAELKTWWHLLLLRKRTGLFCLFFMIFLVVSFLASVSLYQWYRVQLSHMNQQVEVLVELDPSWSETQVEEVQRSLEALPEIGGVEYWDAQRSLEYIDTRILPGYSHFLQKNKLDAPLHPLFRIRLTDVDYRTFVVQHLVDQYGNRVSLLQAAVSGDDSFGVDFVHSLDWLERGFLWVMVFQLVSLLVFSGSVISALISERHAGFRLGTLFGLSPRVPFLPALFISFILSLLVTVFGALGVFLLLLRPFLQTSLFLFVALMLVDVVVILWRRHRSMKSFV